MILVIKLMLKRKLSQDFARKTVIVDLHQEHLAEHVTGKKVGSDDSSGQSKCKRKQKQESRKTIDSTHRGDDYNSDEISSDQVENVTKTTVDTHRGKDGRCSTKSTKPIKNTHRRNIHDLEKISSVQDENVTKTTVDTHRGIEECH